MDALMGDLVRSCPQLLKNEGLPLWRCNSSALSEAVKLGKARAISSVTWTSQARRQHLHVPSGHSGHMLFLHLEHASLPSPAA